MMRCCSRMLPPIVSCVGPSMRDFLRFERYDVIAFLACAVVYVLIVFGWNLLGIADSDIGFIRGVIPVIGDLPPQSISKFVISVALYLIALIYALIVTALGPYRKALPQLAGIGVLTFLAW